MKRALAALLIWAGLVGAGAAQCRQALALGLDVSGSVDTSEYRLQLDGLADALLDPAVSARLLAMPSAPVQLAVYEWSGTDHMRLLLDWTAITDAVALDRVAATLRGTTRVPASPGTALGTAMQRGAALLAARGECWKRTLDLSGDGKQNTGPHPRDARDGLAGTGITINALVVGADAPNIGDARQVEIGELSSYFNAHVRSGPRSFVETALGFEDFRAAMTRKLIRELEGLVLSRAAPSSDTVGPRRPAPINGHKVPQ